MKLQELFETEEHSAAYQSTAKWRRNHAKFYDASHHGLRLDEAFYIDEQGKIHKKSAAGVWIDGKKLSNFSSAEMTVEDWSNMKLNKVTMERYILNAEDLINTRVLTIQRCTLKSLKGAKLDRVEELHIYGTTPECGVLYLMKMPKLKIVEFSNPGHIPGYVDAFEIVQEMLDDGKSILDCQNELIDYGLEDLATL